MFPRIQKQPHGVSATSKASEDQGQDRTGRKDVVCEGMGGEDFQALCEPGVLSLGKSCRIVHSQALAGGRSITIHVSMRAWYFQAPSCNALFPPHATQGLHYTTNSTETTAFSINLLNQVNFVIPPGLELLKKASWKNLRCKDVA